MFTQRRLRLTKETHKGRVYAQQAFPVIEILESHIELEPQLRRAGQIDTDIHAEGVTGKA